MGKLKEIRSLVVSDRQRPQKREGKRIKIRTDGPVSFSEIRQEAILFLDNSGSMASSWSRREQASKIDDAKSGIVDCIQQFLGKPHIGVTLVVFGGAGVVTHKMAESDSEKRHLIDFVRGISATGGTPLLRAMTTAKVEYKLDSVTPQDQIQVVIATDGQPNEPGRSDRNVKKVILELADEFKGHGIHISTIAIGDPKSAHDLDMDFLNNLASSSKFSFSASSRKKFKKALRTSVAGLLEYKSGD